MKIVKKYIDMHVHVGSWSPEGTVFSKNLLLDVMRKNDVSAFCISTLDCIDMNLQTKLTPKSEIDGNRDLVEMFCDIPEAKFVCVCEPNNGSARNIRKLLEDFPKKFCALKLHPLCHCIPANSELYNPYMEVAQEYGLPCLFHSGHVDCEYSSPRLIYELAKRYKDVPVILGHLSTGGLSSKKEAVKIMKRAKDSGDANLYADISWCDMESVVKAVAKVGEDRIMFATDAPLGVFGNAEHYAHFADAVERAIINGFEERAEEVLEKVFYSNAKNLFGIAD